MVTSDIPARSSNSFVIGIYSGFRIGIGFAISLLREAAAT